MIGPNFFIVGAPKCGTTSWSAFLGGHHQIDIGSQSEPHFFSPDYPGYPTTSELDEYLGYYSGAHDVPVRLDCSPLYLYSAEAPKRIADFAPAARILILLREQSRFLPSWHNQLLYSLNENLRDFGEAWCRSGRRSERDAPATCRSLSLLDYRDKGHFAPRVECYLQAFGPARVCVAWMEDWRPNPIAFYEYLLDFLELPSDCRREFVNANPAHRLRSRLIGRISHRPPRWLVRAVARSKAALGIKTFGVGPKLLRMNRAAGYSSSIPPQLSNEIAEVYRDENAALNDRLRSFGCLYTPR